VPMGSIDDLFPALTSAKAGDLGPLTKCVDTFGVDALYVRGTPVLHHAPAIPLIPLFLSCLSLCAVCCLLRSAAVQSGFTGLMWSAGFDAAPLRYLLSRGASVNLQARSRYGSFLEEHIFTKNKWLYRQTRMPQDHQREMTARNDGTDAGSTVRTR
jgi:hypothetical protein